jgi:hypothetical protein
MHKSDVAKHQNTSSVPDLKRNTEEAYLYHHQEPGEQAVSCQKVEECLHTYQQGQADWQECLLHYSLLQPLSLPQLHLQVVAPTSCFRTQRTAPEQAVIYK